MSENRVIKLILFGFISWFLTSCGSSFRSTADEYTSILNEESRCEVSTGYVGGISVVGSATFEKRTLDVVTETVTTPVVAVKLKNMSLGDPLPAALPIKNAEIAIYDSNNQRIQCGATDISGNLKAVDQVTALKIPKIAGTYKIRVISRSYLKYNSDSADFIYIAVKKDKYRNEMYALSAQLNVSVASTSVAVNLIAKARQTDSENIEGGAFNILNSLQTGFDYIKLNTVGVNTKCLSNKLNVYWKAGFNPLQYQSPDSDPTTLGNTSYYSPITKELFISGGQLGDMSLSNTDHFDDFAIIHESGHFIEDFCGQWTSPGGSHNIISRIDPRLAWSEGWANYFAAHVIHDRINDLDNTLMTKFAALTENSTINRGWTYFFNSYGFSDSVQNIGNGDGFVIDFKRSGSDPGSYQSGVYNGQEFDKVLPLSYPGEGFVREGSISRGLFKLTNACDTNCAATSVAFIDVWRAFDRITGTAVDQIPFQGLDKVLEKLKTLVGGATWIAGSPSDNDVIASEALHLKTSGTYGVSPLSWPGYATNLVTGSVCNLKILPKPDSALNNSSSDQRFSNHFYTLDFSLLPGIYQITVSFTKNAGNSLDHDLILFKPGYFFNDDYTCTTYNSSGGCSSFTPNRNSTNADVFVMNREPATSLTSYTKTIFLNGIDQTKKYLLDLRTYTAGVSLGTNTDYSYSISSNLGALCPQ